MTNQQYILLLRGINVGGKHKVVMHEFKQALAELGFTMIESYINSGNFLFYSQTSRENVLNRLTDFLQQRYSFSIPFTLIETEAYRHVFEQLPSWWHEPHARRDVLFYTEGTNSQTIETSIQSMPMYNERVYFSPIGIFWAKLDEKEYLKTSYHKHLIKSAYYRQVTIRNANTCEKLLSIIGRLS